MKAAFINTLSQLMHNHQDIITITADMGFSVFENIQKIYPLRFFNTGVTEQASAGFATGLALTGYKVFYYAQAVFITARCFEQIRLDVAYHSLNVKIIGSNAGFSLNQMGVSHFAVEDVALMRLLPTLTIFTPGDPKEIEWALKTAYIIDGPVYLRYTKTGNENIHRNQLKIKIGDPILINKGDEAVLFVCGGLLSMGLEVVKQLKRQSININLYSVPTVKPLNKKIILDIARKTKNIFTLEEHSIIGGLGSAIAEIITESNIKPRLIRFGIPEKFTSVTGSIEYLLALNGISPDKIASTIVKTIS